MSEFEVICAVAFLFSAMFCLATERDNRQSAEAIRPLLLGNAVFSTLVWWADSGIGLRHAVLLLALALGATEAGLWAARGLNVILPPRRAEPPFWGWKNDPSGCGLTMLFGLAMLVAFSWNSFGD